jgi:phospholipid/cholesterol/gamma-HCH transport system substrate-binding protein
METRANYVLIGLFTLAIVVAGFGFVYWFTQTGAGTERASYRILFDGSVSGLRQGASVLFNGIKVGEVTDLKLNPQDPKQVSAIVGIDKSVPVRSDTKVSLEFQGLTGIASISLKGGSLNAAPLPVEQGQLPTLMADSGATQEVTQSIRDLASRADGVLQRLDGILADNEKPFNDIMVNLKTFTETLDRKSVALDEVLANAKNFTAALDRNSDRLDKIMANVESMTDADTKKDLLDTVRSVRVLAENLDKRTAEISAGLTKFTGSGLREWEQLAVDGRKTLAQLDRAVRNLDRDPSRVIFGGSGNSVPEYNGRR